MPANEQESQPDRHQVEKRTQAVPHEPPAPSVQVDLNGFLTELGEWIEAVRTQKWEEASDRLRDVCDEAYCLEGWKEFTNRLGTSNMQHHVHHLRRFLVAVETTARALGENAEDETSSG